MLDYRTIKSRYRFTGTLTLETALHIGSGQIATVTDSPILRNAAGEPFIPGSSLKGAFRAAVARIAPNLGLQACDVFGDDDFCLSPQKGQKNKDYLAVRRFLGSKVFPSGGGGDADKARKALRDFGYEDWIGQTLSEDHLLILLEKNLCPVCKVFGSPFYAAKARFDDLPVENWFEVTEVRDGVGIDRDSERAVENIKFDFEVVPAGTSFRFGLTVENPTNQDLGLIAIGLREMQESMVRLGGIRSRGLGQCRLTLEPVQYLNFGDVKMLQAYLKGDRKGEITAAEGLVSHAVQGVFGELGGSDAQTTS
ncbi:MAG: hypothetical protein DRP08_03835 [Candidatus Aenigmatarchaeota archaeon]|nr:MAG: hypothetical protein DRP08_03835 [Candidatus Aenigmarchaeota archaeon]